MNTSNIYNKHMNLSKRIRIEELLNKGKTITEIAEEINKSRNTIYYEIKNHRQFIKCNRYNVSKNYNMNCSKTSKTPFVCNSCPSRKGCRKNRFMYYAEDANREYKEKLINSRQGINMNAEEFNILNKVVKDGIDKGLSFSMILNSNKELNISKRTLYNYQEKEYLDTLNIELPRKVRYKKRTKKQNVIPKNTKHRVGRTYEDFKQFKTDFFIKNKYDIEVVQMDTVEGIKGENEAVLLTLLFTSSNFLMAFKMEHKTSECVSKVFDYLKDTLGYDKFHDLFKCILTDNGSEFSDPDYIENNGVEIPKTYVFYCDPNRSDQKAKIEVCHEFIRRYIPKGKSFNNYSQKQITEMVNHINSVPRDLFKGQCAFSLQYLFTYESFFELLDYKQIRYDDLCLNRNLFKQKNNTNK
ncbi:MAG: IS30 family transposase [Malacoplasma sp.]